MTRGPRVPAGLLAWLALLGASSGAPFALVNETAGLLYRAQGVALGKVGLLSLLGWVWSLKVLWAPAMDRWGSRRTWIVTMQAALALALLGVAALPGTEVTVTAWLAFTVVAFLSATQDVAVDAYAVDAVPSAWVGPASGVRSGAYRVAMVLAGGTLLARVGTLGWSGLWIAAGVAMGALAVATLRLPPIHRAPTANLRTRDMLRTLLARPGVLALLAFVALFKVGDQAMAPMTKPFLLDHGFTLGEIGDLLAPALAASTVAGALLGGWLTHRWGVVRALVVLGLLQAVSNLGYFGAALEGGHATMWAAAVVEPFCGGLGTAPFVSLLMLSCDRRHAATQFALLTAIFGLVGRLLGGFSGEAVKAIGYAPWFAVTFALALPAFALLPWVRRWLTAPPEEDAAAPGGPPAPGRA